MGEMEMELSLGWILSPFGWRDGWRWRVEGFVQAACLSWLVIPWLIDLVGFLQVARYSKPCFWIEYCNMFIVRRDELGLILLIRRIIDFISWCCCVLLAWKSREDFTWIHFDKERNDRSKFQTGRRSLNWKHRMKPVLQRFLKIVERRNRNPNLIECKYEEEGSVSCMWLDVFVASTRGRWLLITIDCLVTRLIYTSWLCFSA